MRQEDYRNYSVRFWFQFTHPGGVRPQGREIPYQGYRVSIHAPGRGATPASDLARVLSSVSIHAPGRGATVLFSDVKGDYGFQFTHPGGVRLLELGVEVVTTMFQFTHPGGVRPGYSHNNGCYSDGFNSRTREGCDDNRTRTVRGYHSFNSRTREGCDIYYDFYRRQDYVSIHAPGRGATGQKTHDNTASYVSIHAPGRGATQPHFCDQ